MEYGLLGKNLIYSFSPIIHKEFGEYQYELIEGDEAKIRAIIKKKNFKGINVTNPYKVLVKDYCDYLDKSAKSTGCVNTVVNKDGRLYGFNTDYYGFLYTLKKTSFSNKKVSFSILGAGATAKMAKTALADSGFQNVKVITRNDIEHHDIEKLISDTEILINCTPVGVFPNVDESYPIDITKLTKLVYVFDLNYNPLRTKLLIEANKLGCRTNSGLLMLVAQGKMASEIFQDKKIDDSTIDDVCGKIRKKLSNIVLIGMPGSGKTTIGKELANMMNREFVDIDRCIERREKNSISNIIQTKGIEYFRQIEKEIIKKELLSLSKVISTGGGAVEDRENLGYLMYNSVVIYLKREINELDVNGRPLCQGGLDVINNLYDRRSSRYIQLSDHIVKNDKSISKTAEEIIKWYEKNISN